MSESEQNRADIVRQVSHGDLKEHVAAYQLKISVKQLRRILEQYHLRGDAAFCVQHHGRPKLDTEKLQKALEIIRDQYRGEGPTTVAKILIERHGIAITRERLRLAMIHAGLWTQTLVPANKSRKILTT
jgi:transposase